MKVTHLALLRVAARQTVCCFLFFVAASATCSFASSTGLAEQWQNGPNLSEARSHFGFVQLPSGDILAAGGLPNGTNFSRKVDKYSLASGLFVPVPDMPFVHRHPGHAILLPNGKFFMAGEHPGNLPNQGHLYTEASNSWSSTGAASLDRFGADMALLPNGKVLYAGGYSGGFGPTYSSAELFDPGTESFAATGSMTAVFWWLEVTTAA